MNANLMIQSPRHRQAGQSLIWVLATIAACCAVMAMVYNIGQVTNEKERTINAADAAAISGALVEARILNFEAYSNRAMIANEVTIAQFVSLDSWVQYNYEITQWVANYLGWVPGVGAVLNSVADAMNGVSDAVNTAMYAATTAINAAIITLKGVSEAANALGVPAADSVAKDVAEANVTSGRYDRHPQMVADTQPVFGAALLLANENAWMNFTNPNYQNSDRANAGYVITHSLDQFTTNRGLGYLFQGLSDAMAVASAGTNWLEKTSGTTTLTDYDHWQAQDSLDSVICVGIFGLCITKVYDASPPLGYGRTDLDADGTVGNNLCSVTSTNCTLAVDNANTIQPTGWQFGSQGTEASWDGIPYLRDIKSADPAACSKRNESNNPGLLYVTAVQKEGKATLTTQRIGTGMNNVSIKGPMGSPDLEDNLQNGDSLTSISAGCVFFQRPDANSKDITAGNLPRSDGVHEYASLYNPYWQARLTMPDPTLVAALYTALGQPALTLTAQ